MGREGHARECSPAPLTPKLGSFKERQPPTHPSFHRKLHACRALWNFYLSEFHVPALSTSICGWLLRNSLGAHQLKRNNRPWVIPPSLLLPGPSSSSFITNSLGSRAYSLFTVFPMVSRPAWLAEEQQCLGVTCVHSTMSKTKCSEVGLRGSEHSVGAPASWRVHKLIGHWKVGIG